MEFSLIEAALNPGTPTPTCVADQGRPVQHDAEVEAQAAVLHTLGGELAVVGVGGDASHLVARVQPAVVW